MNITVDTVKNRLLNLGSKTLFTSSKHIRQFKSICYRLDMWRIFINIIWYGPIK